MKNKNLLFFSMIFIMLPVPILLVTVAKAQTTIEPIIVCTTSAIGSIVEEFLGDTADVLVLVQPGLCPADFDMKPGYVDAMTKATILFKQGIPGEFWLDGLVESAGNENLIQFVIPGAYNTPEGAKNYIQLVGKNLSQVLNVNLESKISEMLNDVDEVTNWIKSQSETLDASTVNVICMNWLRTYITSIGFNVVATYNPPETLSANDITSLLQTASNEDVTLVVDNLQIDVEFGGQIASQVGAEHVVLTNFPGAIPDTETLSKMFRYNAEQLFNATTTWQYTSSLKAERDNLTNQITLYQIAGSIALVVIAVETVLLYILRKKK